MKKFEYKIIDSENVARAGLFKGKQLADIEAYLCDLGHDGWEIINIDFNDLERGLEFRGVAKREVLS